MDYDKAIEAARLLELIELNINASEEVETLAARLSELAEDDDLDRILATANSDIVDHIEELRERLKQL